MSNIIINKNEGKYWGFAYLRPHSEKLVLDSLNSRGHLGYLPVVPRARMHHYTKVITEFPMFPSYIFLCLDLFEAADLKAREKRIVKISLQQNGVIEDRLINELHALQQCEALAKSAPILINPDICIGDKVLITSGELKGLETDVVRRDDNNNSIIINITILQKHIEYPVSAEILKKITS